MDPTAIRESILGALCQRAFRHTPIVYPISALKEGWMKTVLLINPVTAPVELFRYAILGQGAIMPGALALSTLLSVLILIIGVMIFNKVEKTFMDTV